MTGCRSTVRALFPPLAEAARSAVTTSANPAEAVNTHVPEGGDDVAAALMTVYQDSDAHAGLYNYAKALEAAEAGLLDYFYQHFRLAGTSAHWPLGPRLQVSAQDYVGHLCRPACAPRVCWAYSPNKCLLSIPQSVHRSQCACHCGPRRPVRSRHICPERTVTQPPLFCVTATVIGSDAKGTMNRAVSKLRVTYEKVVFPELDAVRSQLGAAIDIQSAHVKVRVQGPFMSTRVLVTRRAASFGTVCPDMCVAFHAARDIMVLLHKQAIVPCRGDSWTRLRLAVRRSALPLIWHGAVLALPPPCQRPLIPPHSTCISRITAPDPRPSIARIPSRSKQSWKTLLHWRSIVLRRHLPKQGRQRAPRKTGHAQHSSLLPLRRHLPRSPRRKPMARRFRVARRGHHQAPAPPPTPLHGLRPRGGGCTAQTACRGSWPPPRTSCGRATRACRSSTMLGARHAVAFADGLCVTL